MSLATLKEVLEIAERTNTAIPGFNIDNIEIPEAIMEAAEVENCPVILTIGQGAINAGGLRHLPDVVRRIAESSSVPVVMHLDHSESYEQVIACLRAGFTSVMYDGSHYPFEENVRESQAVVRAAHAVGVSVECELGAISGVEDGISHSNTNLVDLDEVKRFIAVVNCDALAVGITFAFLQVKLASSVTIIGCITLCFTIAGVLIGNVFGTKFKDKATILGGVILIAIGVKILLEHLGIFG